MSFYGDTETSENLGTGLQAGVLPVLGEPSTSSGHGSGGSGKVRPWNVFPGSHGSSVTKGYNLDEALSSFSVAEVTNATTGALNKFPAKSGKRDLNAMKNFGTRSAAVREVLKEQLDVKCGRCFRSSCQAP